MSGPRVGSATFRFDDLDSFTGAIGAIGAIGDADLIYVPVNPGSFHVELTQIQVGRVILQLGRDSPQLSRGVAGAGRMGTLLSLHGPEGTIFDSRPIGPADLMMFRGGAPLDSTTAVADGRAHMTFPDDDGEALNEAWGGRLSEARIATASWLAIRHPWLPCGSASDAGRNSSRRNPAASQPRGSVRPLPICWKGMSDRFWPGHVCGIARHGRPAVCSAWLP